MRLLHEYDATDTELLIYAMTLINKTLNGIPDQDTYYDQVDLLEEQDIESVIRKWVTHQFRRDAFNFSLSLNLYLLEMSVPPAVVGVEAGKRKGKD